MKEIGIGLQHTSKTLVTERNTAISMGSGELPVFATPEMIALMENAAMMAVEKYMEEGYSTVGSAINIAHIHPSAIGTTIIATATLTQIDGRKLIFHVVAKDDDKIIGEGEHVRYIVDAEKFMSKIK
jgi:fluoroacetyl-CoA thioesterase